MPPLAALSLRASRATIATTSPAIGCLRLLRASGCTCTLRRFPWQRMTTGEGMSWWDGSAWPGNVLLDGWYTSMGPHPIISNQPHTCRSAGPGSSSAMGTMWRPRLCMIPMRWSTYPLRACSAPADTSLWSSVLTAAGQLQAWLCATRVSLMVPKKGCRGLGLGSHTLPFPPSNSSSLLSTQPLLTLPLGSLTPRLPSSPGVLPHPCRTPLPGHRLSGPSE